MNVTLSEKGAKALLLTQKVFSHERRLSDVMFDRARWFLRLHDWSSSDGFQSLCSFHEELHEKNEKVQEPVLYALGYAHLVFLCTAAEITLLHCYLNSLELFRMILDGEISRLKAFQGWLSSMRQPITISDWEKLPPDRQKSLLYTIPFSDLANAHGLYTDIYGSNCFVEAWSQAGYQTIRKTLQELQEYRNGIIHRGGEFKNATMIKLSAADFPEHRDRLNMLNGRLGGLVNWCFAWWVSQITQRFAA